MWVRRKLCTTSRTKNYETNYHPPLHLSADLMVLLIESVGIGKLDSDGPQLPGEVLGVANSGFATQNAAFLQMESGHLRMA